jgi:hypothetical protein
MTRKDEGHFSKKHAPDRKVDPKIADAVKSKAVDDAMSCTVAFEVSANLKLPPDEVGFTMDSLEIRVIQCQLGLFGYKPSKRVVKPSQVVAPSLKEAIQGALVGGRLSCRAAWDIAEKLNLRKLEVSSACETLKVKISSCQLGTF